MATSVVKVDNKKFESMNTQLEQAVDSIIVKDAATCLEAKKVQKAIRDELKQRHFVLDPFVMQAKANYDDARDERAKWIDRLETLDETVGARVKTYEREEREAAAREQDRINKENARIAQEKADQERRDREAAATQQRETRVKEIRALLKAGKIGKREAAKLLNEAGAFEEAEKAAAAADAEVAKSAPPPAVTVKPNIPVLAGVPSRVNWRYRITNENLVPDEYWMLNEQKIGADVRRDKEKTSIPGVEAYPD